MKFTQAINNITIAMEIRIKRYAMLPPADTLPSVAYK
jgi:hypothetical protein